MRGAYGRTLTLLWFSARIQAADQPAQRPLLDKHPFETAPRPSVYSTVAARWASSAKWICWVNLRPGYNIPGNNRPVGWAHRAHIGRLEGPYNGAQFACDRSLDESRGYRPRPIVGLFVARRRKCSCGIGDELFSSPRFAKYGDANVVERTRHEPVLMLVPLPLVFGQYPNAAHLPHVIVSKGA